ncbi:signal peptidase I [Wenyingzhuangia heitensis]|uniref:signal peptidase I n=1 Tax=Wenyingzhuangia heitensis TaxID=1487859 RepID=UPI0021D13859|nr:signal peptidase I [Wenyingzhuangia heitensis]
MFFVNLWWLSLIILFYVVIHNLYKKQRCKIHNILLRKCIHLFGTIIFLLSLFILCRLFVFDLFYIPSDSMEGVLYEKDIILVNKLSYGPKTINANPYTRTLDRRSEQIIKRLSGFSTIQRNDVVVFRFFKKNDFFVKRCVAIAGDSLYIKDGIVYVNGQIIKDSNQIKHKYLLDVKNKKAFQIIVNELGIVKSNESRKDNQYWANLSLEEIMKLSPFLNSFHKVKAKKTVKKKLFPKSISQEWTIDDYGVVFIPKQGYKMELNTENFRIYKGLIAKYEGAKINRIKNGFSVDGVRMTHYTFKQDYYFMMGDNRCNSYDSRFTGFIPKEKIVGKVSCVFFSNKDNQFQWGRIGKGV